MAITIKGRKGCPQGTKEYFMINKNQMSGKIIKDVLCAKNDTEIKKYFNKQSWPQKLYKRIA